MFKRIIFGSLILSMSLSAGWFGNNYHAWVSGEGLLLRPTLPDNYYTIRGPLLAATNNGPQGNQISYCPGYEWGYRVEVGVRCCSNDLRVDWTSLNTTFSNRVSAGVGQVVWATLASPGVGNTFYNQGAARVFDSHRFRSLDGDVGHWRCSKKDCLATRMFVGVRYARFEVDRIAQYFFSNGVLDTLVRQFSDSQGVGPRVGVAADYRICWGFHLAGQLAGSLLIGSTKGFYFSDDFTFPPLVTRIRNQSECIIIPSVDIKFGLGWGSCLCGLAVRGDVGYQLNYFSSGVQRTGLVDLNNSTLITGNNNTKSKPYALDGFYFRLGAEF